MIDNLISEIITKDKVPAQNGTDPCYLSFTKHARYWVDQLNLQQHPFMEEAYFRETFVDSQLVQLKGTNNDDKSTVENRRKSSVHEFST